MWFKRSDGGLFSAEENSASFQLMSKDGSFETVIEDEEIADTVIEDEEIADTVIEDEEIADTVIEVKQTVKVPTPRKPTKTIK